MMDTLSYFHPSVEASHTHWNDQGYNSNSKWTAPSPTHSSEALESYSHNSPSLSFSETLVFSNMVAQQDLLPELWLELPPAATRHNSESMGSGQAHHYNHHPSPGADFHQHEHPFMHQPSNSNTNNVAFAGWNSKPRSNPPPGLAATAVLRDSSLEYAQSLLPHSLLMPLTQENLDFHKATKPQYNEFYTFDNSQNMDFTTEKLPHPHKARNNSVSSTSSSAHSSHSGSSSYSKTSKATNKSLNTQLYKTELCMSFMKTNVCPYGNKCQFAHGEAELKRVERPSNWRSKPCANWTRYGSCRYGKRCCFKHGE
ncbi:hypothetical protein PUMCH_002585 [Australozyma saopauloensis]|uniref:C3H1-type domain-containing protein n=1 Tax=Australozyma saopauloensis TaxID=291208 RepID=A0AAX4H9W3_9ASCO|nr:hypothetical protein PUMCH_002585 [[Candida] saopauloensis]